MSVLQSTDLFFTLSLWLGGETEPLEKDGGRREEGERAN